MPSPVYGRPAKPRFRKHVVAFRLTREEWLAVREHQRPEESIHECARRLVLERTKIRRVT